MNISNLIIKLNKHLQITQKLRIANLPKVNGVWDYKALNLIYLNKDNPVLIDPDYAGCIPRVIDLALSVVLFHNYDLISAHGRVFTQIEFEWFFVGYSEYISLTSQEKELWEDILDFMLLEEGLWLILNSFEDAQRLSKADFLASLAEFNSALFAI